jgi:hypothetical protein
MDMNFNNNKIIKIPETVHFDILRLSKTSANKEKEYQNFVAKVHQYMKEQNI